jgi:hypothetical protein
MITFDKNSSMKGVRKGDFFLQENILKCKALVQIELDETYEGASDYMWGDIAIPAHLISYFSMYVSNTGTIMKNRVIITLDDGKDLIIKGNIEDLVEIYNVFKSREMTFKFN